MIVRPKNEHGTIDIFPWSDEPWSSRIAVHTMAMQPSGERKPDISISISGWQTNTKEARQYVQAILKACEIAEEEQRAIQT